MKTATAWDMIGWDDGKFRVAGGKTLYEAVMYNARRNAATVRLSRLVPELVGFREVRCYVAPDTRLEFMDDAAFDAFCEEFGITPTPEPAKG